MLLQMLLCDYNFISNWKYIHIHLCTSIKEKKVTYNYFLKYIIKWTITSITITYITMYVYYILDYT